MGLWPAMAIYRRRNRSDDFRKLLCFISDRLEGNDIQQILYLRQLATTEGTRSGLDVLKSLEKRGEFSPNVTQPLVQLLKEVNRHDIAYHVKNVYQATYPDQADESLAVGPDPDPAPCEEEPPEEKFDRKNVVLRSYPMSKVRNTGRRCSDRSLDGGGMKISVEMPLDIPLSPTKSLTRAESSRRSKTLSILSVVSDGSGKKLASSTASLRLINELDNSNEPVMSIEHTAVVDQHLVEQPLAVSLPSPQKRQGFPGWKQIFGWKGKKASVKETTLKRVSKCSWKIDSEVLLSIIRHEGFLKCIKCPKHPPIDIGSGEANPYVSLYLYPQGLFDDVEKSMTLQYKVVIPDDCPPISTKGTFDLSWCISAKREHSSTPLEPQGQIQVKFKTGMGYIYKFLLHSQLSECDFKFLKIKVHVSTSYSDPTI